MAAAGNSGSRPARLPEGRLPDGGHRQGGHLGARGEARTASCWTATSSCRTRTNCCTWPPPPRRACSKPATVRRTRRCSRSPAAAASPVDQGSGGEHARWRLRLRARLRTWPALHCRRGLRRRGGGRLDGQRGVPDGVGAQALLQRCSTTRRPKSGSWACCRPASRCATDRNPAMAAPNRLQRTLAKLDGFLPGPLRKRRAQLRVAPNAVPLTGTAGSGLRGAHPRRAARSALPTNASPCRTTSSGVHAAAMTLVAETATGMVVGMNVRDDCLPLCKSPAAWRFRKRATGAPDGPRRSLSARAARADGAVNTKGEVRRGL